MPDFTEDIYEIRLRQSMLGQECINMFYYADEENANPPTLDQVSISFNQTVVSVMNLIQSDAIIGVDIRTRKLGGINEHVLDLDGIDGLRPGQPRASFTAWGYRLNRTNIDMRNGSKRVAGVSEDDANGNTPDATADDLLQDLGTALGEQLVLGSGAILSPVIYRRESFEAGTWFGTKVSSAIFTAITSQVSRKARPG